MITGKTPTREREALYAQFRCGESQAAGGLEGRQLRHRPAGGERGDPGVRHVRLAPGGGAAAGADPAAEGRGGQAYFYAVVTPRHGRPGLRRPPPALPDRAGLSLSDRGLHGCRDRMSSPAEVRPQVTAGAAARPARLTRGRRAAFAGIAVFFGLLLALVLAEVRGTGAQAAAAAQAVAAELQRWRDRSAESW